MCDDDFHPKYIHFPEPYTKYALAPFLVLFYEAFCTVELL
jgi:hypothetical protein